MYKIAVIDDNRSTAEMIARVIPWETIGCMVCGIAYDGLRGKELIQSENPDIIISDIRMPGMDGLEMIKDLHRNRPKVKVIFLSAYDEFAYAQKALLYHAHEFLVKPFEKEKLLESVKRAIAEISPQAPPEAPSKWIDTVKAYVAEHPGNVTLQETADYFGFSPAYFSTLIKRDTGESFMDFLLKTKIDEAKRLLRDPKYRINEVAEAIGYKNYISFYKMFTRLVGVSPREYRNQAEKE